MPVDQDISHHDGWRHLIPTLDRSSYHTVNQANRQLHAVSRETDIAATVFAREHAAAPGPLVKALSQGYPGDLVLALAQRQSVSAFNFAIAFIEYRRLDLFPTAIERLAEARPDFAVDGSGARLISQAVQSSNWPIIRALVEKYQVKDVFEEAIFTEGFNYMVQEQIEYIEYMLKHMNYPIAALQGEFGASLLMRAAQYGSLKLVHLVAPFVTVDFDSRGLRSVGGFEGQEEDGLAFVHFMLNKFAYPAWSFRPVVDYALQQRDFEVVHYILKHSVDEARSKNFILVQSYNSPVMLRIVSYYEEVGMLTKESFLDLLYKAVRFSETNAVISLIEKYKILYPQAVQELAPLFTIAAQSRSLNVMQALLRVGVELNAYDIRVIIEHNMDYAYRREAIRTLLPGEEMLRPPPGRVLDLSGSYADLDAYFRNFPQ